MAVLSKIKIGEVVYDLKDADSRSKLTTLLGSHAVEALGAAAWENVAAEITESATGVAGAQAVKSYVDAQVGKIHNFDIVVADKLPTPSEDTMYKLYLIPQDQTAENNTKDEYITVRSGEAGAYTYAWEKIGSTEMDLGGYVLKTQTIAGVDLQDNITKEELQTALGLGALAYKDSAAGKVAGQTVTGIKATGDISGTVTLNDLTQTATAATLEKANYTPAGSITGDAIKGGSINVTLKDEANTTEANITAAAYTPAGTVAAGISKATAEEAGYTMGGTVSKPDVTLTSAEQSVLTGVATAGTLPTYTEGAFTGGSFEKGTAVKANTDAMKMHIAAGDEISGDVDAETLIVEAATKADVMDYAAAYTAATYAGATFTQGAMPTFNDGSVNNVTAAELANAPEFTGEKIKVGATFTGTAEENMKISKVEYYKQAVDAKEFTPVAATLGFAGTEVENALVTGVTYDKATANGATFAGDAAELAVGDIVITEKDVTVE